MHRFLSYKKNHTRIHTHALSELNFIHTQYIQNDNQIYNQKKMKLKMKMKSNIKDK